MSTAINLDSRGNPLMMADRPSAKQAPAPPPPSSRPATVSVQEWARRQDAVREAAREFEPLADQDVRERLRGVTSKSLSSAEVARFRVDARHQHVNDLVDVLDQAERGRLRARRTVRLSAPRGYVRRSLSNLAPHEAADVRSRLEARGWEPHQLAKLDDRLPRSEPDVNAVMDPLLSTDVLDEPDHSYDDALLPSEIVGEIIRPLTEALARVQAPTITVAPAVDRRVREMIPTRDPVTQLITGIRIVEVEADAG